MSRASFELCKEVEGKIISVDNKEIEERLIKILKTYSWKYNNTYPLYMHAEEQKLQINDN